MNSRYICYIVGILVSTLLQACGGGGGGGASSGTSASSITVSGTVQAPGGQVAMLQQSQWATRLASLLVPASHADVTGLAGMPDGTVVELVRVDPVTGTTSALLATTTVSAGRYSFNLTKLGLDFSTTLQAKLAGSSGIQMRTFISNSVANLDPNSEAGVQLVLESIAAKPGSSLAMMTNKDLDDVVAAIDMATSATGVAASATTAATVSAIKAGLNVRPEVAALLNNKLTAGHADTGSGDIANYFPLAAGDTWTYSVSENGAAATSTEVVTVGTPILKSGVTVMPVATSTTFYPLPSSGTPNLTLQDIDWYLKDASGLVYYGNSTDPPGITAIAPSYLEIKLPAKPGDSFVAVDKTGNFDLGEDWDGDGISETLTQFKLDKVVTGYQSIRSFRCMVVENHVLMVIMLSASKVTITINGTVSWYLASGIGIVRIVEAANFVRSDGVAVPSSSTQRDLIDATIAGVSKINQPLSGTIIKTVPQVHNDLVYDKTRNRLYASIPGTEINGNSIAVINPDTGALVQNIVIGTEPNRLALSSGDEYLYVGLNGSGEVARINLATMAPDLTISLGMRPTPWSDQLVAGDIAVLPNSPTSIVVSEKSKVWSPSFVGLVVFDGAIKRTSEIPSGGGPVAYAADAIAVSDDGAFVYGVDNQLSSFEFTRFSVAPTGITFADQTNNLTGGYGQTRARYFGGQLYLTNGRVIDTANKVLTGAYQVQNYMTNPGGCIPDALLTRTYCLTTSLVISLVSFDRALFTQMTTINTSLPVSAFSNVTMIRFGARGFGIGARSPLAVGTSYDQIYLIYTDVAL